MKRCWNACIETTPGKKNLRYWNAQSNDGFHMWKTNHEVYEGQCQKFDYSGTNGFLITIHFTGTAK